MGRPAGSRNRLVTLDYDSIGALVGIRGNTARRYAQRGLFDSRDLESILRWVNERRKRQGEPLIGLPTDDAPQAHSDVTAANTPTPVEASLPEDTRVRVMPGGLAYDPMTGGFRGCDDSESR